MSQHRMIPSSHVDLVVIYEEGGATIGSKTKRGGDLLREFSGRIHLDNQNYAFEGLAYKILDEALRRCLAIHVYGVRP